MNNSIYKITLLFSLLLVNCGLYASQQTEIGGFQIVMAKNKGQIVKKLEYLIDGYYKDSFNDQNKHCLKEVCYIIIRLSLPDDLSYEPLQNFNFDGFTFVHTNLIGAQLEGAFLGNTTSNYAEGFISNIKNIFEKNDDERLFYRKTLSKDLRMIDKIYNNLSTKKDKAELLVIAFGISCLPIWTRDNMVNEFYINLKYYFGRLLDLKDKSKEKVLSETVFSLEEPFENILDREEVFPAPLYDEVTTCFSDHVIKINNKCENIDTSKEESIQQYIDALENNTNNDWSRKRSVLTTLNSLKRAYQYIDKKWNNDSQKIMLKKEICEIGASLFEIWTTGLSNYERFKSYYECQKKIIKLEQKCLTNKNIKKGFLMYDTGKKGNYTSVLCGDN